MNGGMVKKMKDKFDKVLEYPMLYPSCIVEIVKRYKGPGCKNRAEYEYMINTLCTPVERRLYL